MESIEPQFASFSGTFQYLETIGFIFLLAIVCESVWDVGTGERKRLGETAANFTIAIVNALLERTAYGLAFIVGLILAAPFALIEIPHAWWSWGLAVIAADLTYYWMHRLEHEVRILWAHHSVHHSSPEFNLTTALRLAWIEGLIEWVFFVPMILAGFSFVQTIIAISIVITYQTWIHTQKIGKLGWLDSVFNTPSVHRVHHGSNPQYIDKNYGGILILWDRLFGTFEPEGERVAYSIIKPVKSVNPFVINFHEYWQIAKDIWRSKSLADVLGYVFGRPGWKPETAAPHPRSLPDRTGQSSSD